MTCGVYSCRNRITGDQYIGSSNDIERRRDEHLYNLRRNQYHGHWQNAWDSGKYAPDDFEWFTLEECEEKNLLSREQYQLDMFWPTGYNVNPIAGRLGRELVETDDWIKLHQSGVDRRESDPEFQRNRLEGIRKREEDLEYKVRRSKGIRKYRQSDESQAVHLRNYRDPDRKFRCKKCGSPISRSQCMTSGRYGCPSCNSNLR